MRQNRNYSSENRNERNERPTSSSHDSNRRRPAEPNKHWQEEHIKTKNLTTRIGQVFGLIYNLTLLYLIFWLIGKDEKTLALKIFIVNATLIVLIFIITLIEKNISSRRTQRRGGRMNGARNYERSRESEV